MAPDDLSRRVTNHNFMQVVIGVALILGSILLWLISIGFFRAAFFAALDLFVNNAETISLILAWLCMIPLVIEGVRHTRPLFDLGEIKRSGFQGMMQVGQDRSSAMSFDVAYYGTAMFIVTQILYAAPRTMVLAIKAFQSRLPADAVTVGNAARILSELKASREWTPAERYQNCGAALPLLLQMDLIWAESKAGQFLVRYPAGQN